MRHGSAGSSLVLHHSWLCQRQPPSRLPDWKDRWRIGDATVVCLGTLDMQEAVVAKSLLDFLQVEGMEMHDRVSMTQNAWASKWDANYTLRGRGRG